MNIDRLNELFELDAAAGILRRKIKTSSRAKAGSVVGCLCGDGYLSVRVDGRAQKVHRIVFALANGYLPKEVDHADGDRLNNRPANLRAVSRSENLRNAKASTRNKSGIKGVFWDKSSGKWVAHCRAGAENRLMARFKDLESAIAAVRAFREMHHGEFCRHA